MFNVKNNGTLTAVVAAAFLLLEIKFWPEMKTREKKDNKFKSKHLKKNSTIYSNIKLVQIL